MSSIGAVSTAFSTPTAQTQQAAAQPPKAADKDGDEATESKAAAKAEASAASQHRLNVKA